MAVKLGVVFVLWRWRLARSLFTENAIVENLVYRRVPVNHHPDCARIGAIPLAFANDHREATPRLGLGSQKVLH